MEKLPEKVDIGIPPEDKQHFQKIRRQVAALLLGYAGQDTTDKQRLSQHEMAQLLHTSWELINKSLITLQAEGAIRFERHRLFIKVDSLVAITGNNQANK